MIIITRFLISRISVALVACRASVAAVWRLASFVICACAMFFGGAACSRNVRAVGIADEMRVFEIAEKSRMIEIGIDIARAFVHAIACRESVACAIAERMTDVRTRNFFAITFGDRKRIKCAYRHAGRCEVAQLVERLPVKQGVVGSRPALAANLGEVV